MISKIKHTLKKYLFVLVAISIALGGVNVHNINSPFTKKKTSSVAIVNNQKISRMLYDNIAKKEIDLVRKKTKKSLSSKNIVMIKYRILNQLISEFLLSQYAIKQKLYIKDRDVKKIIKITILNILLLHLLPLAVLRPVLLTLQERVQLIFFLFQH